ncbi:hypothetical protein [Paenibacillus piri]|uniref:Uncharacterized protein n=1 Tax=Paenibacillus piri TaxID=2547395 RepID=A0A4R5KWL7_9BACL|nr:hypothetical protein [Paenibacillus piri]TDG00197.1 hypothetical protein E1757_00700 [Paenibacillus piri]
MIFRIPLGERSVPVILLDIARPDAFFKELTDKLHVNLNYIHKKDARIPDELDVISINAQPAGWETTLYFSDQLEETVTFWIH